MKTQLKMAAAAALIAGSMSSAFAAETFDVDLYRANPNATQTNVTQSLPNDVASAFAQAHAPARQHRVRANAQSAQPNPTAVYANGKYIGQDPDANIRLMLQKDFSYQ